MSTHTVQIEAGDIIRRQAETIANLTTQVIQLELTAEALRRERDEARAAVGAGPQMPAGDDVPRVMIQGHLERGLVNQS